MQHRFQHVYIVDEDRRLLGAVSLHDVKTFLDRPELENVVIAADKDVKYDAVMRVMDELQRADVRRVGLLVKPAAP